MRKPVVGISTYAEHAQWGVWSRPAVLLPRSYTDAVTASGAVPILLPPVRDGAAEAVGAVDALVLAGGSDIDPGRYGGHRHPSSGQPHPERDAWELALLAAALASGKPVLGICRGMQLLNVALGGDMIGHLPDVVGHHGHQPGPAQFGATAVRVRPASRLGAILGTPLDVLCYHHQAVARLGAGLLPAAWAHDETVEAIEHAAHEFVLGVQWHPEEGVEATLFTALTEAARKKVLQ
jgi:putative glutamine amidotransferase